jgi:hypothetical protein
MLLIYPGPFDAVDVPAVGIVAVRDVPVDVPDETAPSLIAQGWRKPPRKKTTSDQDKE